MSRAIRPLFAMSRSHAALTSSRALTASAAALRRRHNLLDPDFHWPTTRLLPPSPASLWNEFSSFEPFFRDPFHHHRGQSLMKQMPLDVSESANAFSISAEVPGFAKDQIKLDVADDTLTITAETSSDVEKDETDKDEVKYHIRERTAGKFQRSIKLPVNADVSAITAKFVDGVLSLEVPKKDPAPERKEITID
eukprot:CAMPEP_0204572226 /NCGR_PEP_ID=MMETSP0661-20131031/39344_1 /ASSEMBLY_ACC=CAM_ASM_000606 /TAXON_ID=109239 /ORGANISM="Alexandrium margalefi, Strain AMGDE01CS-322" /LENGTH=193 /DNA_ID=CAMNT_0051580565 /DNA_START=19 /DNA_END=600 /DNA_ORIENTATION=-